MDTKILSHLRAASTFLSIKGYRSAESGELADYQLIFHMSYENALRRSVLALEGIVPKNDLEARAKSELIASFQGSLTKVQEEPLELIGEHYDRVNDESGNPIKGIKVHRESGELHLFGLLVKKTVREAGTFKASNKRPLTVAKDELRKLCPVSKFRQFIVNPAHCEVVNVEHQTLIP